MPNLAAIVTFPRSGVFAHLRFAIARAASDTALRAWTLSNCRFGFAMCAALYSHTYLKARTFFTTTFRRNPCLLMRKESIMHELIAPSFVRIIEPVIDAERGRQLLIGIYPDGQYCVGLRDGSTKLYLREEIEEWSE